MVKKTLFKYSSVLLSVVLIASTLTGCGTSTAYNQTGSEVAISSEAASNTENIITNAIKNELSISNTSTLKTNTRDEMVYVFDKADGTQDHVLVTEKVTDSKGETTTNQSTSDKTAPVSIKVTYKLNGVETKPEDMIGKSGKVTIRYDYTNNEKKTIKVNGKSQTAYVPFTMITGTLLPTDKFSNVEVTNGKVSKVGDNIIALGMTMPGLKDTLNLKFDGESLDMDIPEYFEISADVEDFELDMSMSVATTSTLNDIDTDDFSLAKLEDKMNELQSAADQLTDGTVTLQNGTQTLADSIPALTDGVNQLNDGASQLKDGIYAYTDGATALAAGAGQLKDGISAYTAGANQLGAGAGQLQSGLKTYTDGVGALNAGSGTLQSGLSTYTGGVASAAAGAVSLQTGLKAYTDGVASAEAGASQLNEGIKSIKTALIGNVVKELAANSTAYKMNSVADSTGKTVTEQAADLQKLGTVLGLSDVTIATDLSALGKKSSSEAVTDISAYFVKYLTAYTTNIITETYTEAVSSGKPYSPQVSQAGSKDYVYANQLGLLIKAAGNIGASSALDAVVSNLSNNETINAALKQLTDGSQSLTDGLGELVQNNDTLNAGASQLNAGLAQLSGNNDTLNGGIAQISAGLAQLSDNNDTLNGGIAQISAGLAQLNGNNDSLNGGIEQIAGGFSTLNSNNEALRSGSTQLADGTSTLKSSSVTLADGVTQLNDGAITLKDGMAEFNETGIKAITSLVGDDADTAVDTIKEVIRLGQNYNTFLGKSDGKDNSVTFIYKTAELIK
jgi:putative membrane protein